MLYNNIETAIHAHNLLILNGTAFIILYVTVKQVFHRLSVILLLKHYFTLFELSLLNLLNGLCFGSDLG